MCVCTCEHVWWCPCPPRTEGGAVAASGVVGHLESPQPSEALAWALEATCAAVLWRNDSPMSGIWFSLAPRLQGRGDEEKVRLNTD